VGWCVALHPLCGVPNTKQHPFLSRVPCSHYLRSFFFFSSLIFSQRLSSTPTTWNLALIQEDPPDKIMGAGSAANLSTQRHCYMSLARNMESTKQKLNLSQSKVVKGTTSEHIATLPLSMWEVATLVNVLQVNSTHLHTCFKPCKHQSTLFFQPMHAPFHEPAPKSYYLAQPQARHVPIKITLLDPLRPSLQPSWSP
jgi:hypothetical protein